MKPKTLKIIYWIVTILFVAFFSFGAVSELTQNTDAVQIMTDLGYPPYLNYIIGIAKILGAVAIIQWKWKTIKEWAYAGFTIDIIGAAASFYFVGMGIGSVIFTLAFLVPLFASYFLWKKVDSLKKSA